MYLEYGHKSECSQGVFLKSNLTLKKTEHELKK